MRVAEFPIALDHGKIEAFCSSKGIRRLNLFGSVVRDDFDPAVSDVDVLAEFMPGALDGVGLDYFGYGDELARIIGRKVDFCSKLNKYILPSVRSEMLTIYERA
jgi:predicted nucleotidyltransferase